MSARRLAPAFSAAGAMLAVVAASCGGGAHANGPMTPLAVSLSSSTVVLPANGMPVRVQVTIRSPSETAILTLAGLPGGVQEMYAATDTNPSGLLTFQATMNVKAGTYMPVILVNSAGETASLPFTMVVTK